MKSSPWLCNSGEVHFWKVVISNLYDFMTANWKPTEKCSALQRILNLFMLTVMNTYRLSIAQMLSDFTNPVGKFLLLITREQVGNCSSDVNGVLLDRHQYRREHNLAPWMLPTKAQLYYPVIWPWQPVSLNCCLTSSHGSQCEPLRWLKRFSVDPFGSQIGFQIRSPLPTWIETHILDGADLTAILSEDWPHFDLRGE